MNAFSTPHAELILEIRRNVSFRLFNTESPLLNQPIRINDSSVTFIDTINTIINDRSPINTAFFLHNMRRMSTLAIGYIINSLVKRMNPPNCYLNIGTFEGFTFFSGLIGNADRRCIAVDNFSQFGGPKDKFLSGYSRYKSERSEFYDLDYVDYLTTKHSAPIGVYVYDGPHDYQNQHDGLKLAEPFFAPDAVILVDDTNDDIVRKATSDFIAERSEEYRVLLDERTFGNEHPTFWNGFMIIGRSAGGAASR